MYQGLVKAALPTFAAAAFMALAATPSPAFTLSAPSLDKPTAASNIEEAYWVRVGLRLSSVGLGLRLSPVGLGLRLAPPVGLPLGLGRSAGKALSDRRSKASRKI